MPSPATKKCRKRQGKDPKSAGIGGQSSQRSGSEVDLKADFPSFTIFAPTKHHTMGWLHTSVILEEEGFAGFIHCMILLSMYYLPSLDFITEDRLGRKADKILAFMELWFWRCRRGKCHQPLWLNCLWLTLVYSLLHRVMPRLNSKVATISLNS